MRGDIVLVLGLVTVVGGGIVVAVVLFFGGGEGAGSPCDDPLVALGDSDISQLGFQTEDVALTRMNEAASVGNLDSATEVWYENDNDVHSFTHNVDAPLREADEEMARELCEAVIRFEDELISERPSRIATEAIRVRDLLRDAAEALGFARPGG